MNLIKGITKRSEIMEKISKQHQFDLYFAEIIKSLNIREFTRKELFEIITLKKDVKETVRKIYDNLISRDHHMGTVEGSYWLFIYTERQYRILNRLVKKGLLKIKTPLPAKKAFYIYESDPNQLKSEIMEKIGQITVEHNDESPNEKQNDNENNNWNCDQPYKSKAWRISCLG